MNWMVLPNQVCLIVKFYNNRPELLPDSNEGGWFPLIPIISYIALYTIVPLGQVASIFFGSADNIVIGE